MRSKRIRSTFAANRSTLLILNRLYLLIQQQNVVRGVNTAVLAAFSSQVSVMACLKHYLPHSFPEKTLDGCWLIDCFTPCVAKPESLTQSKFYLKLAPVLFNPVSLTDAQTFSYSNTQAPLSLSFITSTSVHQLLAC